MYKYKYIKYKNKYLNLISQIGGECDDGTDLNDLDIITQEQLNTRSPIDRITIDGHCYFVDELYQWVLGDRADGYDEARVTLPHNRSIIKRTDLERLIILHDNLPPGHSPNVSDVLLASARVRCIQDEGPSIYTPEPVVPEPVVPEPAVPEPAEPVYHHNYINRPPQYYNIVTTLSRNGAPEPAIPEPAVPEQRLYLYRQPIRPNRFHPRIYHVHARNNDNQIVHSGDLIDTEPPTEFWACLCEVTNPNNLPLRHNIYHDVDVNYVGPC